MVDHVVFTYSQILSFDDRRQVVIIRNILKHHDPGLRIMCPSVAPRLLVYICLSELTLQLNVLDKYKTDGIIISIKNIDEKLLTWLWTANQIYYQLQVKTMFNSYDIFYNSTRNGWPFNTGDCLIEVIAWTCLTVLVHWYSNQI